MGVINYDEEMGLASVAESPDVDGFSTQLEDDVSKAPDEVSGVRRWLRRIPKNVAKGAYLAALNTLDTLNDIGEQVSESTGLGHAIDIGNKGLEEIERSADEQGRQVNLPRIDSAPISGAFPDTYKALHDFGESMTENDTVSDGITQAVAQFGIPFAGYLKVLGGWQKGQTLANVTRAGTAEAVTAGSVFRPDEGRFADLVEFGRQMDNDFGGVLNRLSPEGSALNAYINWMTDRSEESEWEGRFKNAVDSTATTAAMAAALKVMGVGLRVGRQALTDPGPLAGTPAAQSGMVTFHTTPFRRRQSEFIDDVFSLDRIGEGEGVTAFGHGLYFAENPAVANQYKFTTGFGSVRRHFRQELADDADFDDVIATLGTGQFTPEQEAVIKALEADDWLGFDFPSQAINAAYSRNLKNFDPSDDLVKAVENSTLTLEVDIPDEAIARFLDRDAQFDAQPDNVKQAILKAQDEFGTQTVQVHDSDRTFMTTGFADAANRDGSAFYEALESVLGSQRAASEWLNANGVPGLKFLDAQSRTFTGQGGFLKPLVDAAKGKQPTRNFVLFDPEQIASVSQEGATVFKKGSQ